MRRRAEAQRRRGLAEAEMCGTAGPHGRRRCAGPRGGSSRTSRDAQGHAVPRGREVERGSEVAVAASPRSAPTLREFSRALLCSLFPSLLSFPRSIKPALDFCHSISRPISTLPLFPARFPARPLDFLPARSISHMVPRMAPASSSMASRGRLRTPRRTPCL